MKGNISHNSDGEKFIKVRKPKSKQSKNEKAENDYVDDTEIDKIRDAILKYIK